MKRRPGRKLLVASAGVAAVSYVVACHNEPPQTTGNLMAPDPTAEPSASPPSSAPPDIVGNLVAPPPFERADAAPPQPHPSRMTTGNLMPPPPPPRQDAGAAKK